MKHEEWRQYIFARDGYCQVCGGVGTSPHHVKFRGAGGKDDRDNGILLCGVCHGKAQERKISAEELLGILRKRGVIR